MHGFLNCSFLRDIALDETHCRANVCGRLLTGFSLQIHECDLRAAAREITADAGTETGSAAGDDGFRSADIHGQTRSIAIATASPPPMHSEAMPRRPPRAMSACSKVATMRAPVAPTG